MNLKNAFRDLTKFEWGLWLTSVTVIIISALIVPNPDIVSMIASFIGVTALIFVAKGYVLGQILCIIFAVFYGIVSFYARYYGEMITYLGMSAPAALFATISWIRNPYKKTSEVKVARLTKGKAVLLVVAAILVTWAFYYILGALGTANLLVSTISVATSFFCFHASHFSQSHVCACLRAQRYRTHHTLGHGSTQGFLLGADDRMLSHVFPQRYVRTDSMDEKTQETGRRFIKNGRQRGTAIKQETIN